MKRSGETGVWFIAWVVGGFVLSIIALFSVFGGFILAVLMVAATPFVLGFLVVEAIFGKRPVYVTSWKAEEAGAVARTEGAPEARVSVRVIRVEGACPTGRHFIAGDTWILGGNLEDTGIPCPVAYQMLKQYAEHTLPGQEATAARLLCTNGHMIEFELRLGEAQPLAAARR